MNAIEISVPVLLIALGTVFAVGFAVARLGTWFRIIQIEARFRGLAMDIFDYSCMSGSKDVPVEWVIDQLRDFIRREFRSELRELDG